MVEKVLDVSSFHILADEVKDVCYAAHANNCGGLSKPGISKKQCCCGEPQRGFGFCNPCPVKGTGKLYMCDPSESIFEISSHNILTFLCSKGRMSFDKKSNTEFDKALFLGPFFS